MAQEDVDLVDYKGREIYVEIVYCGICNKDLGYFNGNWVDGSIQGICMDCHEKIKK